MGSPLVQGKYQGENACDKRLHNNNSSQFFIMYVLAQQSQGQITETVQEHKANTKIQSNELTHKRGNNHT